MNGYNYLVDLFQITNLCRENIDVGVLLNPAMAAAWRRNPGECKRAINYRIVSVHVQLRGFTSYNANW